MVPDLLSGLKLLDELVGKGLVLIELGLFLDRDKHERDPQNAKHSSNDSCESSEVRFAIVVAIPDSGHCHSCEPNHIPEIVIVLE